MTTGVLRTLLCVLALLLGLSRPAAALEAEIVHADEPLWAPGSAKVWPRHLEAPDTFGCQHRVRLGQWRFTNADSGDEPEGWYIFGNYGVVHCWMNIAEGYEPGVFGDVRPGFLIEIGRAGEVELWALQIGARPGSEYLLLSRRPGPGPIERFEVLQRTCSRSQVRGGASLDVIKTRYCAINSKGEMIALARRMAKLPVLGILSFERED